MIPNEIFQRPLIAALVVDGLAATGLFWLHYSSVLARVIATDHTYMAASIIAVFAYLMVATTMMAWELNRFIANKIDVSDIATSLYFTKFDVVAFLTFMLPTMGFLGTVAGLAALMNATQGIDTETFASVVSDKTSAALFPTAAGLVAFMLLSFKRFLLTHSFRIHGFAREL